MQTVIPETEFMNWLYFYSLYLAEPFYVEMWPSFNIDWDLAMDFEEE